MQARQQAVVRAGWRELEGGRQNQTVEGHSTWLVVRTCMGCRQVKGATNRPTSLDTGSSDSVLTCEQYTVKTRRSQRQTGAKPAEHRSPTLVRRLKGGTG